jgi:DNA (cytosine-5)-methyltransferase 1
LYVQYGKFLKEFQPKVFVFENVPGLLSANDGHYFNHLKEYFKEIGYETDHKVLNAKDYGVLQSRRRVIIIGWKLDLKFSYPEIEKTKHNFTTEDIFDLSPLKAGESKITDKYTKKANDYLNSFELRNGVDFYTQHITRPHNENDLRIYKLAIEKWNGEKIRLKYNDIPEKWRTQKNTESFLDRFKVVDGKGISHTVIAHIAKDGHYYIHPDIEQCRSLSIREAARIQSFPDNFYFEGSRTAAFRQIGNAVPPLMSDAIAKGIIEQLKNS